MADADQSNLTTLTVDLLSAYVTNNTVEHGAIPDLIKSTHAALKVIDAGEPPAPEEPEHKPAVTVRKSLASKSHIISLIDGKPYLTLKRHLSKHDLTPEQYRERYGLPKTYPMVAPAYSESRRAIAEKLGLGRRVKGAQAEVAAPGATSDTPAPQGAPAKAAKPAAAKTAPVKAPKTTAAKAKAPAKPKTASAPAEAEAPAEVVAKPAPRARKAPAAKKAAAPAEAAAPKPAPRKRAAKAAEPAS